jgi:DNA-binding transcriptional LysR family regulator
MAEYSVLVRHLSYFTALARERHFARAAAVSNITQPTLSAAIRTLEDELGVRLVVRGHSFVGLTPQGEKLLEWGRLILADYASLRDAISDTGEGLSGTLRLGIIPTAAPVASLLTARFAAEHPRAMIDLRTMSSRALQKALNAFEIDGGITYLNSEPLERVIAVPLYTERYVFLTQPIHPLASRGNISWAEALDQPLCLLSTDMQNRRIIDRVAAAAGLRAQPRLISESLVGLWTQVAQGPWASIVPHSLPTMFGPNNGVTVIPLLEPDHHEAIGLVVSERDPHSPMVEALLAISRSVDFATALVPAATRGPNTR